MTRLQTLLVITVSLLMLVTFVTSIRILVMTATMLDLGEFWIRLFAAIPSLVVLCLVAIAWRSTRSLPCLMEAGTVINRRYTPEKTIAATVVCDCWGTGAAWVGEPKLIPERYEVLIAVPNGKQRWMKVSQKQYESAFVNSILCF
jgi:hypothetical protein